MLRFGQGVAPPGSLVIAPSLGYVRTWLRLEPLIARPGMVLSRAQLEEKIFGWGDEVSSNAVEVYVHGLRKKLGSALIQTVRGVGYKFLSRRAAPGDDL